MNIKEFSNLVDEFTIDDFNKHMHIKYKGISFNLTRMEYPLDNWYRLWIVGDEYIYHGIEAPLSNIIAYPVFNKVLIPCQEEDFDKYIEEIEALSE